MVIERRILHGMQELLHDGVQGAVEVRRDIKNAARSGA